MTAQKTGFVALHFGSMTPGQMTAAVELAGEGAVIDTDAARMAGANFAFGPQDLLNDLKEKLKLASEQDARDAHPYLSPAAAKWLGSGERGMSSEAMFSHLLGVEIEGREGQRLTAHPLDPADLRRCRLLLEAVPHLNKDLSRMAELSPQWAALIARWDEICDHIDRESPKWRERCGSAPTAYDLMQEALATSSDF